MLALAVASGTANAQVLPPPPERPAAAGQTSAGARLFVREFRFEGNTAFTSAQLAEVTRPFTGRELTAEDLEEARRAVSLHYASHGYVNSGAVLPDQNPANGVVLLRIIEGRLSAVEVHDNRWLRERPITRRLRRWAAPPLNLNDLKEGLQQLRQNPNVRQLNAELKPGLAPGESILDLRVRDVQPFRVGVQVDNQRPPSVGAEEIWLNASDLNVTGHSDVLDVRYGVANSGPHGFEFSGADNLEGRYVVPITRYDTTLGVHGSRLSTSLVEESFLPLDVRSETLGVGGEIRQPVYQTASQEAAVSIGFDHRRNDTWLLGQRFNLSPGAIDGESVVSVLRLSQDWLERGPNHVFALRSTFNFGLDAFDATDNGIAGDPDARFFSWVGQGQYLRRLFDTPNLLVLRVAGQWASESLLALEQISVGGMDSVRGYRENQLVRDRGFSGSLEFRVPVVFDRAGAGIVTLAPFLDGGGAWNNRSSTEPTTLSSVGIGLLANPDRRVSAELYWGYRLRHIDTPKDENAQDLGLHFKVNISAF